MLYLTIIFQLKLHQQQKTLLGLLCYDEVNTLLLKTSIKSLIYKNITSMNNDFIKNDSYIINIITKYYDKPNFMDDVEYDIIIDHKDKKAYMNKTFYNYYDVLIDHDKLPIPWEGNIYEEDELEYILPEYNMIQSFTVPYYDYLDSTHENYDLKNIFDINDVQGYNELTDYQKEEVEDRIRQNIEYRDLLENFNNKTCFQDDYIEKKLEDTEHKLQTLEYIFKKSYDLELTYASLLCKKYKYSVNQESLKSIKYNFIVSKISDKTDDRGNREIIISIESNNGQYKGHYRRLTSASGECYDSSSYIDEDAKIDESDADDLLKYLYDYLFT